MLGTVGASSAFPVTAPQAPVSSEYFMGVEGQTQSWRRLQHVATMSPTPSPPAGTQHMHTQIHLCFHARTPGDRSGMQNMFVRAHLYTSQWSPICAWRMLDRRACPATSIIASSRTCWHLLFWTSRHAKISDPCSPMRSCSHAADRNSWCQFWGDWRPPRLMSRARAREGGSVVGCSLQPPQDLYSTFWALLRSRHVGSGG